MPSMILAFPVQAWKFEENRIAAGKPFNGSPSSPPDASLCPIVFDIEILLILIG
ncbi:hypothetical protein [Rhizobium mongolense]|uniref:Uncharacterized protein n=1 Tax=Rhizobium mongolense TaxID=57676 RepID=A0A7W6WHH8_9HYPH|nr:hypothetical protein [Rhizobium mongolense]MBB4278030.1 hypothetical protein [Rhizobium mongolense]